MTENEHRQQQVDALQAELDLAHRQLEARNRELVELTRMLEERDGELEQLRATRGLRLPFFRAGKPKQAQKTSKKQVRKVEQSGLFDADWYLQAYPDLQQSRWAAKKPLQHYLRFGGFEARNPSLHFDSGWYLSKNPDVEVSGMNPLVHYVEFGQGEGRLPKPNDTR